MLQLANNTPFAAERAVQLDPDGVQHWVVVVKATYMFTADGIVSLHSEQEPVCPSPVYAGAAGISSLLRESEFAFRYLGTDVIVNGSSYAPQGRPTAQMDVQVAVGPLRKRLRVYGDRTWVGGLLGMAPSQAIPFTRMPLAYEQAYGGIVADGSGGLDPRNPVGRGFGLKQEHIQNRELPNVEDPAHLIHSWRDRPAPAGFGALAANWTPRRERGGTYDAAWQEHKLPLLPDDFDPMFFSAASPGLHSAAPLRGGERVVLEGLTQEGTTSFSLPREVLMLDTWLGSNRIRQAVDLHRVIIEPDERRLLMVWGSTLRCGTRFREIVRTRVDCKLRVSR